MGQHLLSVRILFHATFALVYLPIIGLGFTTGLDATARDEELSFVQTHVDGMAVLTALVGLGIFAALDILTIRRNVNQRAFLIIEVIVVVLMPLSMWPLVISSIPVVWSGFWESFNASCWDFDTNERKLPESWYCDTVYSIGLPVLGDEFTYAGVVSATVAILALSAAFLFYICIAAVKDKLHSNTFLPIYLRESSVSLHGTGKQWYLFGTPRTPTERAVVISQCTEYIFRNSIFRKHAFEPTIWAIFRGIIAVYSCVGLVVFSAYSALSESQLRGILTVKETISLFSPYDVLSFSSNTSVASFLMEPINLNDIPDTVTMNPQQYPPPILSVNTTSGDDWENLTPGFWMTEDVSDFNISWTGEYALVTWVTSNLDPGCSPVGTGVFSSKPLNLTNPLVLAPFKKYSVSLISISYQSPDCGFSLWTPDIVTSVDSEPGSNAAMAIFSFNGYQQQQLTRDFNPPSMFSSVARVLSVIGGTLSAIDGVFALVFGRTIVAIIVGSRIVSPFGLLGMVTHNRFKRLIHEEYPLMQEEIKLGGMAAYISEVAIDAALIDKPSAKGPTTSAGSFVDIESGGENIELRHQQVGSSVSHLRLPYEVKEFGDPESIPLVGR